ncbi:MAG: tRNA (adenosine(37)-N6)-threonylcarbamoyltransferase complex ATPase subunit type 1 TsaE [Oscillospiraceae bacterium]|nr:tRNA (adenosine(37)-N6)-threonylcarbamoyltransferase complex ATPase subunit type 1 TsaE [Oscillospiraceae bacterium]
MQITTHTPAETARFAAGIGRRLRPGTVVACFGGMGAGKTAFTRGLCEGIGLPDLVSSPTFALVNEYHAAGRMSVYHFDMYRVTSPDALETTGFWDYPLEDAVFVIEWAENIPEALAALSCPVLRVTITGNGDLPRGITVEGDECLADPCC